MNNSDELADTETLQIIGQRIAPSTRVSYYRRNDYSLITILWKFRIENPIFTPSFMISHVKKASISRPIKFYVCSHKNGCKHRFFNPIFSQYCYYSLITILWKFRIENPIFTPSFMISHVKKASISRPIKFYVCSHKNGYKHRIFHPILSKYCYYSSMTILWKFQIENPISTSIFMILHVKKASILRPIKFYVCSHKNGCKHRIFHPILSQYCYYTIITIFWKYWMKNPMFTPILWSHT